jgi:predicted RND superfamily exporter protein
VNSLITRITRASLAYPWRFLAVALGITVVAIWLATGLSLHSSFEELLPSDLPAVMQVKELERRVGGDGTVLVSIETSGQSEGLAAAKAMAPKLAQDFLALGPSTVRSVEWNQKSVETYFQDHWPLFLSVEDLAKADDAIHDKIKKARRMALGLDLTEAMDEPSPAASSPLLDPKQPMPREQVAKKFARLQDGFMVHPDGKSLVMVVRPAGTSLGVDEAKHLLEAMHKTVDKRAAELTAAHLRVGFAGSFPIMVATFSAIINDIMSTALLCLTLVLGSLLLFFRDVRSTISLLVSVLIAVAATFGITWLVIGYLNTQTAFLGSIVVGNGINYGVIYLARVRQLRRAGMALEPAVHDGALRAAHATLLASAASSVSFAMLILAANRGFRHFGFIGGVGMLLCWGFTFTLLPALLAICEKVRPLKPDLNPPPSERPAPPWMVRAFSRPRTINAVFMVLMVASVALFWRQRHTAIETNLDNLTNEATGDQQLRRDNDRGGAAMGRSNAGAVALVPSRDAADAFCRVIIDRQKDVRYHGVIEGCDTISSVVPSHQDEKLALIQQIHDRLTEPVLKSLAPEQATKLRQIKAELAAQVKVTDSDAPQTLMDRFRERDGSLGRLAVVTARPQAKLEIASNLQAFVDAVRNVPVDGKLYNATGEQVIFADLLNNIEVEGPLTTAGSLLGVCALVLLFLRRWRMSREVIAALVAGVVLMGGVAALMHLKINFFNFIVFPITFGIAVDYGANVIVRIRERGGDVLSALYEVGPAVAICSWTSMIGYGSLIIALNRALQSFGWYALVGEVTSIATALVLLPAMARVLNPTRESRSKA